MHNMKSINIDDSYTYFELYTIIHQISKDLDSIAEYT